MTRVELTQYIFDTYSVEPDYPFSDDNVSAVFRHPANRKWFALAMNIPARRLGLPSDARMDIVNLKCDPNLIVSLRGAPASCAMFAFFTLIVCGFHHVYAFRFALTFGAVA